MLLSVEGLTKSFNGQPAVKEISFSVEQGDIVGLLGPNGAGKTTAIRCILGIYEKDGGTIRFGTSYKGSDAIGYLPEDRGLYPDAPVLDCLVYLGLLKGLTRRDARKRARHWLKMVELEYTAERRIETLSKGMQQKVQFIAAIIHRPVIAFLDEAFSGLDPVNQELMIEMIQAVRAEGTTLLVSSHQLNLVESLCRRIVLVEGGEAILSGDIDALRQQLGVRVVRISFEGDADFLNGLPGITVNRIERGKMTLGLDDRWTPDTFLRELTRSPLTVEDVSISWSPLHDIFVAAVKARRGAA